jgi:hypothetical protein
MVSEGKNDGKRGHNVVTLILGIGGDRSYVTQPVIAASPHET